MKTARFFTDLSVQLGFTLPVEVVERLTESPPDTVDAFTDEVLRGEGLDPATTSMRAPVRALVAEYLGEPVWDGRRGRRRRA
jgi:hypothetical protein